MKSINPFQWTNWNVYATEKKVILSNYVFGGELYAQINKWDFNVPVNVFK